MKFQTNVLFGCLIVLIFGYLNSCSLYEGTDETLDYLPLDDSEYPYANIPRIVIETENFKQIRYRGEEMRARLQIYGKNAPESEVFSLTLHGRGNSSFYMPKYGLKLEFDNKVSLFGMEKNRDFALIANYGDKTHLRNFLAFKLSSWLNARFTPEVRFVELYLNRQYKGLYLLAETVKVGKHRVNIPENDSSFLFEKEDLKKYDSPFVITDRQNIFHIRSPKNLSEKSKELALSHLNRFENYLYSGKEQELPIEYFLDINDFVLFYWVQEFSKNEDASFHRSVFFSWIKTSVIRFGPVWDFDLAFGNAAGKFAKDPENWYIRSAVWFAPIFRHPSVALAAKEFFEKNHTKFQELIDSVPIYKKQIDKVIKNEYKRWPILQNTENWALKDPYNTYEEAVQAMLDFMNTRLHWIQNNY